MFPSRARFWTSDPGGASALRLGREHGDAGHDERDPGDLDAAEPLAEEDECGQGGERRELGAENRCNRDVGP